MGTGCSSRRGQVADDSAHGDGELTKVSVVKSNAGSGRDNGVGRGGRGSLTAGTLISDEVLAGGSGSSGGSGGASGGGKDATNVRLHVSAALADFSPLAVASPGNMSPRPDLRTPTQQQTIRPWSGGRDYVVPAASDAVLPSIRSMKRTGAIPSSTHSHIDLMTHSTIRGSDASSSLVGMTTTQLHAMYRKYIATDAIDVAALESAAQLMLDCGEPLMASDILGSPAAAHLDSPEIRRQKAAALDQCGSIPGAVDLLTRMMADGDTSAATSLSLGRCHVHLLCIQSAASVQRRHAEVALKLFTDAFKASNATSSEAAIHMACMNLVLDHRAAALSMAAKADELCRSRLLKSITNLKPSEQFDVHNTLGLACFLRSRQQEAVQHFKAAVASAPNHYGQFTASLQQLQLLMLHLSDRASGRRMAAEAMETRMDEFKDLVMQRMGAPGRRMSASAAASNALARAAAHAAAQASNSPRTSPTQGQTDSRRTIDTSPPTSAESPPAVSISISPVASSARLTQQVHLACQRILDSVRVGTNLDDAFINSVADELVHLVSDSANPAAKAWARTVITAAVQVAAHLFDLGTNVEERGVSLGTFRALFNVPTIAVMMAAPILATQLYTCSADFSTNVEALIDRIGAQLLVGCVSSIPEIVFLEIAHRRKLDLWIVLPVPLDELVAHLRRQWTTAAAESEYFSATNTSVDSWIDRLETIVGLATAVDISNDLGIEVNAINMNYCHLVLYGLACSHASQWGGGVERIMIQPDHLRPSSGPPGDVPLDGPLWASTPSVQRSYSDHSELSGNSTRRASAFDAANMPGAVQAAAAADATTPSVLPAIPPSNVLQAQSAILETWCQQGLGFAAVFTSTVTTPDVEAPTVINDDVLAQTAAADFVLQSVVPGQQIRALVFADVVGYSKFKEGQVLNFSLYFMGAVRKLLDARPRSRQPLATNTWGDGMYLVFAHVEAAGVFALELSNLVTGTDWSQHGLPAMNVRISIHAAPMFLVMDPVLKREIYTGVHASRAARIEPITPPGQVYCSLAFAAMAMTLRIGSFTCTYVGNVPLAKNYGVQRVYHVHPPTCSLLEAAAT